MTNSIDDSKKAKRGLHMEAVAKMRDTMTDTYIYGRQYAGAILPFRNHVIPYGIHLCVKPAHAKTLSLPFHKITALGV